MKRLLLIPLLVLFGCAKISLTTSCPANANGVSFALAGSTVGNQAIAMLSSGLGAAGLLGMARSAPADSSTPPSVNTMTYTYLPIFGADSGSLTCILPLTPPTVVTAGPPAAILH